MDDKEVGKLPQKTLGNEDRMNQKAVRVAKVAQWVSDYLADKEAGPMQWRRIEKKEFYEHFRLQYPDVGDRTLDNYLQGAKNLITDAAYSVKDALARNICRDIQELSDKVKREGDWKGMAKAIELKMKISGIEGGSYFNKDEQEKDTEELKKKRLADAKKKKEAIEAQSKVIDIEEARNGKTNS